MEIVDFDFSPIGRQEIGVPSDLIGAAREKLMELFNLPSESITFWSATPVIWNDGSLGCAEDGKYYTMARVPGYKIVFRVEHDLFFIHTDEKGSRFLCPQRKGTG